jgi:citrate lyase subunit beta/citryl-CoA lyase
MTTGAAVLRPSVRSALFVPANRDAWIDKAPGYRVDTLVLDLEDATPPAEKAAARGIVASRLAGLAAQGQGVWVRVNEPGSADLAADLAAICRPGLRAVCVPKIASPTEIEALDRALAYHEGANGMQFGEVGIVPLLETAAGMAVALDVFRSSDRVCYAGAICAAGADVQYALGYEWSDTFMETFALRSNGLLAARAAGVANPLTGLVTALDVGEVRRFAEQSRGLGYEGMFVIHPSHVPIVNEVFSPSTAEVASAKDVLARYADAEAAGRGAIRDASGAMIDRAHVRTAQRTLERHRLIDDRDAR